MMNSREDRPTRAVVVWDLPTRVFHALLIAFVAIGWATAAGKGVLFAIHTYNGYALIAALTFRVVWGFAGSRHSRFADFVHTWPVVRAHIAALLRGHPTPTVGHNPLGGWMVLALLFVLAWIAATGLFAAGEHGAPGGPFAPALPYAFSHAAGEAHEALFKVLVGLIVLHTAGVLAEMLLTGDNPVRTMLTGRKWIAAQDARREPPPVSASWALLVAVVSGAMVWFALA